MPIFPFPQGHAAETLAAPENKGAVAARDRPKVTRVIRPSLLLFFFFFNCWTNGHDLS